MEVEPGAPGGSAEEETPEVMAQIVDDMDQDSAHRQDEAIAAEAYAEATAGSYIPPRPPTLSVVQRNDGGGFHVRLTLSVSTAGAQIAPGLEIDDCGVCPFCLDKPKYGGPGTKRQKCELKQQEAENALDQRDPHVWCGMHLVSEQEMEQMRQISKLPLPEPLVKAIEQGPLPLVWAFKRKRRANS